MVLYPNKLPESERVCFGICNNFGISGSVNTGLCVFRLSPGKKKKSRKINVLRDFFFLSGETGL